MVLIVAVIIGLRLVDGVVTIGVIRRAGGVAAGFGADGVSGSSEDGNGVEEFSDAAAGVFYSFYGSAVLSESALASALSTPDLLAPHESRRTDGHERECRGVKLDRINRFYRYRRFRIIELFCCRNDEK